MSQENNTTSAIGVPRPLVRTNQVVILLSIIAAFSTHLYWILLLPILAGLSGILLNRNFVIRSARHFLRKKPSEYVQEDKSDLRFNQIIATTLLTLSLISLLLGNFILGIIFAAFVFIAASVAIAGFCIGCFLHYQLRQWLYRRRIKHQTQN
ncbi:MAG: DUF4395 domain-containing protein [Streptococcaceae bacterium]|jgi:membrane associated rhomboid family serine protease|nr:DUF4395 domain-containing protein [Streptococcaceae bacterium]